MRHPLALAAAPLAAGLLALSMCGNAYPMPTASVPEGGLRYSKRTVHGLGHRSRSQSGSSSSGLASTRSGGIRIGGSGSTVDTFLNESYEDDGSTLDVAGDLSVLGMALRLQRSSKPNLIPIVDRSTSKSNGDLTQDVVELLTSDFSPLKTIVLENPDSSDRPVKKVQQTSDLDDLRAFLLLSDSSGRLQNSGAHVLTLSDVSTNQPPSVTIKRTDPELLPQKMFIFDGGGDELTVKPAFKGYKASKAANNVSRLSNSSGISSSQTLLEFSVVGFSKSLDPLANRTATISTSAVSGRTFGSTAEIPAGVTLADLANSYGTTVQELMQLNNIPNENIDIKGLILEIPADLSTIDFACPDNDCSANPKGVVQGDTITQIADKYGISKTWLMEVNGVTDPNFVFDDLSKLQIPGARAKGGAVLPEALPTNSTLETADYGAYTQFEETYQVEQSPQPLFQNTLRRTF